MVPWLFVVISLHRFDFYPYLFPHTLIDPYHISPFCSSYPLWPGALFKLGMMAAPRFIASSLPTQHRPLQSSHRRHETPRPTTLELLPLRFLATIRRKRRRRKRSRMDNMILSCIRSSLPLCFAMHQAAASPVHFSSRCHSRDKSQSEASLMRFVKILRSTPWIVDSGCVARMLPPR